MQAQGNSGDHRRMVKTKTPGVYRRGGRYVVVYYADGKQRKESARTYEDARRLKSARESDVARGEFHEDSRITFQAYFDEWIERYQGRGRRGFRDATRDEYRRLAKNYALPYFGPRLRVAELTPRQLNRFVEWLTKQTARNGFPLSDSTIANIAKPVRACIATAVQEGIIRYNPTHGLSLPHRPTADDVEEEDVRPFTREELAMILRIVNPRFRVLFQTLAATGLRISEALALQRRHLVLDGSNPHVKVRRALVKGRMSPPKTKYGKRNVPLPSSLVHELRLHLAGSDWTEPDRPVFPSLVGTYLSYDNLYKRVLVPAREEAGVPWAGFHTFRHTCASMLFSRGRNVVQVQRWLGHHSAAFTLERYVHLMDGELGEGLDLDAELGGNPVAMEPTGTDVGDVLADQLDVAA